MSGFSTDRLAALKLTVRKAEGCRQAMLDRSSNAVGRDNAIREYYALVDHMHSELVVLDGDGFFENYADPNYDDRYDNFDKFCNFFRTQLEDRNTESYGDCYLRAVKYGQKIGWNIPQMCTASSILTGVK